MALEMFEFVQSWQLQINWIHLFINADGDLSEADSGLFELLAEERSQRKER